MTSLKQKRNLFVKILSLFRRKKKEARKAQEKEGVYEKATTVLAITFLLLPLLFWSLTPDYYQTAKLALLGAASLVCAVLLLVESIRTRAFIFPATLLFPAALALVTIIGLASTFSINSTSSLFGQFSNPHGGLLSYLIYFLVFLATGVFIDSELRLLKVIKFWVSGASILALLTIFQYFNIYLFPMNYAMQRFWSPMGSTTFSSIYLAASVFLSTYLIKVTTKLSKILGIGCLVLQVLALALLGNTSSWLTLVIAGVVFLVLGGGELVKPAYRSVRMATLIVLAGALLGSSWVRQAILPAELTRLPSEVVLDWRSSWAAATQILIDRPLVGAGPETFNLLYPQVKNLVSLPFANLNITFPRAGVELLQLAAGTGLLGLMGFIFLTVAFLTALKDKRKVSDFSEAFPFLSASTAAFFIFWLLAPAGVATTAALFASLGMVVSTSQNGGRLIVRWPDITLQVKGKTIQKRTLPAGVVVLGKILGIGLILLPLGKYLLADFYYNQAINAQQIGDGDQALRAVNQAIRINPGRDEYSVGAATINLALASTLSRRPEATQAGSQMPQLIDSFVTVAVNQAQRATALVPLRSSNWQNLAEVYRNLLTYLPNAGINAVAAYQRAIQLDPTNPFLSINLGNLLMSLEQDQEAISVFQNAIRIRADLPAAHLGLARALRLAGDLENSKKAYEQVLAFNFDPESEIYQVVNQEYEEVKAAVEIPSEEVEKEAGVEQVELLSPTPVSGQQPLTPGGVDPVQPGG